MKFVLRVIADIRDKSLEVELRYVDLQERYRTLLMYDIEVRVGHWFLTKPASGGHQKYQSIERDVFLIREVNKQIQLEDVEAHG